MILWAFPVFGLTLLSSALLLRRWPLTALAVMLGGSVAAMALQRPEGTAAVTTGLFAVAAGLEVCYTAATRTRTVSVAGAAMAAGVSLLIPFLGVPYPGGGRIGSGGPHLVTVAVPVVMIIAWLIGNSIRQAHRRAELARAQAATQAALAERLRIARELHDIVAHSIGIIAIQAGSGRSVFDTSPGEARDALAAIEATSRETLSGLRRMMTGLRRAGPGSGPEPAPLGPAPGLADLERLAAMTLGAGVRVDLDWHGSREPLPADIDLSAFRIIQEAVTNVVRHASTGQCQVSVIQHEGQLSIEVTDSGPGGRAAGSGYGITGMRERTELLGGDFAAGPRPGGGFRVAARLPLPVPAR
jgi:signal transduction histidine kinase